MAPIMTRISLYSLCLSAVFCAAGILSAQTPDQSVVLRQDDLMALGPLGLRAPGLTLPESDPDLSGGSHTDDKPAAQLLRRLMVQGRAAGFSGLVYDNRDRGHSSLNAADFPGLTRLGYSSGLRRQNLDLGLGGAVLLPYPVIGNSSTAITSGHLARSLPRLAMTRPGDALVAYRAYVANHLYVYPAHRDGPSGTPFPANWAYTVASQGSSGSDRPFVEALLRTAAAFRPRTRATLIEQAMLAPTLQMIMRRCLRPITSDEDYLTGLAHPTVFDAAQLRPACMVNMAASILADTIPPAVQLAVEEESFSLTAGRAAASEKLFTTPFAIARVWRDLSAEQGITLSARPAPETLRHEVSFVWKVLHGSAEAATIIPLDETGSRARISLTWPTGTPHRLDIGVFASAGGMIGAPSVISIVYPDHQVRMYDGPNNQISEVDYDAEQRGATFDPALFWSAPFRDRMEYADNGRLLGWTRRYRDESWRQFDPEGVPRGPVNNPSD